MRATHTTVVASGPDQRKSFELECHTLREAPEGAEPTRVYAPADPFKVSKCSPKGFHNGWWNTWPNCLAKLWPNV